MAIMNGLQVMPINTAQQELLDEVMRERSTVSGGAANAIAAQSLAPKPKPQPAPRIDMSKLANIGRSKTMGNRPKGRRIGKR